MNRFVQALPGLVVRIDREHLLERRGEILQLQRQGLELPVQIQRGERRFVPVPHHRKQERNDVGRNGHRHADGRKHLERSGAVDLRRFLQRLRYRAEKLVENQNEQSAFEPLPERRGNQIRKDAADQSEIPEHQKLRDHGDLRRNDERRQDPALIKHWRWRRTNPVRIWWDAVQLKKKHKNMLI